MIDPAATFTLELDREFDAPAEHIFDVLTEPAQLVKWWGPQGFAIPEVETDLRVGGSYRFTMQPPEGAAFHLAGEFLDIRAPDRLSYTFRWEEPTPDDRETVVVLTVSALGARTKVSLSQGEFATEERLALHRDGWAESFDKLDAVLEKNVS